MNGFNLSAVPRVEPLFAFNTHTLLNASHCLIFIMFTTNSFLKIKQWDAFSCLRPFIVVNSRILNLRSTWAKHILSTLDQNFVRMHFVWHLHHRQLKYQAEIFHNIASMAFLIVSETT